MKSHYISTVFCILFCGMMTLPLWGQENNNDGKRRNQPSPNASSQQRPAFQRCPMEGVWQACNISEVTGKMQMQLIPCLKMVGTTGLYQNITVSVSAEGSKTTENGIYTQINDSTYRREITAATDTLEAKKYGKTISVSLQENGWLVISYTSLDKKDSYQELWKRVSNMAPISMRGNRFSSLQRRPQRQISSQGEQNNTRFRNSSANQSGNNVFMGGNNNGGGNFNDNDF